MKFSPHPCTAFSELYLIITTLQYVTLSMKPRNSWEVRLSKLSTSVIVLPILIMCATSAVYLFFLETLIHIILVLEELYRL
jgi:hypothetical protein